MYCSAQWSTIDNSNEQSSTLFRSLVCIVVCALAFDLRASSYYYFERQSDFYSFDSDRPTGWRFLSGEMRRSSRTRTANSKGMSSAQIIGAAAEECHFFFQKEGPSAQVNEKKKKKKTLWLLLAGSGKLRSSMGRKLNV